MDTSEWTNATWNPVSAGDEKALTAPLRWRKPRRVFLSSMTDIFGEWVSDEMLDRIWAVMALTPQHTYQVWTKRPERMQSYLSAREIEIPGSGRKAWRQDMVLWAAQQLADAGVLAHGQPYPWSDAFPRWPLPNVMLGNGGVTRRWTPAEEAVDL